MTKTVHLRPWKHRQCFNNTLSSPWYCWSHWSCCPSKGYRSTDWPLFASLARSNCRLCWTYHNRTASTCPPQPLLQAVRSEETKALIPFPYSCERILCRLFSCQTLCLGFAPWPWSLWKSFGFTKVILFDCRKFGFHSHFRTLGERSLRNCSRCRVVSFSSIRTGSCWCLGRQSNSLVIC